MSKDSAKYWVHSDTTLTTWFSWSINLKSNKKELDKCVYVPTH